MQPDLLQQLKDLHLPAAPAWWPPAPGWWLVVVVVLAIATMFAWRAIERRRRQRPYRVARADLERLRDSWAAGELGMDELVHAANALLKRSLIVYSGRTSIARLHGDTWLRHLDSLSASTDFSTGPGAILGQRRFDPAVQVDAAPMLPIADRLLRHLERAQ